MDYLNAFGLHAEQTEGTTGEECESCAAVNHAPCEPRGVKPERNCVVLSVLVMNWPPVNWYDPTMP